jgi:hypothetical protein
VRFAPRAAATPATLPTTTGRMPSTNNQAATSARRAPGAATSTRFERGLPDLRGPAYNPFPSDLTDLRECTDEQHVEPRSRQCTRNDVIHRSDIEHDELAIERVEPFPDHWRNRRERQRRPDDERRLRRDACRLDDDSAIADVPHRFAVCRRGARTPPHSRAHGSSLASRRRCRRKPGAARSVWKDCVSDSCTSRSGCGYGSGFRRTA